jgi:hypothetical protein
MALVTTLAGCLFMRPLRAVAQETTAVTSTPIEIPEAPVRMELVGNPEISVLPVVPVKPAKTPVMINGRPYVRPRRRNNSSTI